MTGEPSCATRPAAAVARDWARALEATQRLRTLPDPTLAGVVSAMAQERGGAPAILGVREAYSYAGLAGRLRQFALWARVHDIAPGSTVGLLMENRPDFIAAWLGLTQAGCVVALLGTELVAEGLAHCLAAAGARHVIVSAALAHRAAGQAGRWWVHGGVEPDSLVLPQDDPAASFAPPPARDTALLLFTSGTTGLPKAARVSHARVLEWSGWFAGMMDATADDRLYDCLPLYHSAGGVVAVGAMLVAGGAVVIRERFSASAFWADVAAADCTIVQYIGELCRYLVQSPAQVHETAHRLRLCCGNGLRGEVWTAFQQRFRIPRILEFYAATEGTLSLTNCEGLPGAIGRIPPFLAHRFPVRLIRCDPDTGEPLRDEAGRCEPCGVGEAGEAIAPLGGSARFEGYTDPAASARKVLSNVFAPGDRWFRSGDLMRRDTGGFFSFVDRMGDTYRWKGENISTAEVAAVLASCPGVVDAAVYGVALPGRDGAAGMAALVVEEEFDLAVLHARVTAALPGYARPLLVRLCAAIDRTGTFKLAKTALARDGLDTGSDATWLYQRGSGTYLLFDASLRARLMDGSLSV